MGAPRRTTSDAELELISWFANIAAGDMLYRGQHTWWDQTGIRYPYGKGYQVSRAYPHSVEFIGYPSLRKPHRADVVELTSTRITYWLPFMDGRTYTSTWSKEPLEVEL